MLAVLITGGALALNRLIVEDSSPYSNYSFLSEAILDMWSSLNLIPYFAAVIVGGHAGSDSTFFTIFILQWFLIGFFTPIIISSIFKPNEHISNANQE